MLKIQYHIEEHGSATRSKRLRDHEKTKKVALMIPVWRPEAGQFVRRGDGLRLTTWHVDSRHEPEASLLPLRTVVDWSGDGVIRIVACQITTASGSDVGRAGR